MHETRGYALMSKEESDMAVKRHAVNFMYEVRIVLNMFNVIRTFCNKEDVRMLMV